MVPQLNAIERDLGTYELRPISRENCMEGYHFHNGRPRLIARKKNCHSIPPKRKDAIYFFKIDRSERPANNPAFGKIVSLFYVLYLVLVRYSIYRSIAILVNVRYRYFTVSRYFDISKYRMIRRYLGDIRTIRNIVDRYFDTSGQTRQLNSNSPLSCYY